MKLEPSGISAGYGKASILPGIDITFNGPAFIGLLGENGSGKSTLLKVIGGLLHPLAGRISVNGSDFLTKTYAERSRYIAYMPQAGIIDAASLVYDYIMMGRKPFFSWKEGDEDHKIVQQILSDLELESFAFRMTGNLSGGEQQKILLARVLAQGTPVLLLDEPTSNLDIRYQIEILTLLKERIRKADLLVIMAIHDLNLAARFADYFVLLKDGTIYRKGMCTETLLPECIRDVYGIEASVVELEEGTVVVPRV